MKRIIMLIALLGILGSGSTTFAAQNYYTVQKGDTMWKISQKLNVSFAELLKMNTHFKDPNMIHPNDKIYLPNGSTGTNTNTGSGNQYGSETPHQSQITDQSKQILDLVNAERSKQGLQPLKLHQTLNDVATIKSKDMRDNNYFDHNSPSYGTPFQMMKRFGIEYKSAGENIAAGQKTASEVMRSWMNSSGHRANILNGKYTHLGVGYATGGKYGTYWTQQFIQQ